MVSRKRAGDKGADRAMPYTAASTTGLDSAAAHKQSRQQPIRIVRAEAAASDVVSQVGTRIDRSCQTRKVAHGGEEFLHRLAQATRNVLPRMNDAIEARAMSVEMLITTLRSWSDDLSEKLGHPLAETSKWEARELLQFLGFWVSSIERHMQAAGAQQGAGLAQLPGLEDALDELGYIAQHPPRDTHYTYWVWNRGERALIFTGDPQERVFNRIVNETQRLHTASCEALRPLCRGEIAICCPLGIGRMREAAHNARDLREHFRSFMARADAGQWAMTPTFFMTRMRTYLTTYPIKGTSWGGVNATHLAAQVQLDYLVGTTYDWYDTVVADRRRYLTEEDQEAVQADMRLPSIGTLLVMRLELGGGQISAIDNETLAARIAAEPEQVQLALAAYADLVTAAAQLSATHWALIANYLVKPMSQLTEEQIKGLTVKPSEGVSGQGLEHTEKILEMRRNHTTVGRLVAATNLCRPHGA